MALIGKDQTLGEGTDAKKQFVATFDNGTLEQLEDLKTFFKQSDKTDLVRLAISLLQRAKESQEAAAKRSNP